MPTTTIEEAPRKNQPGQPKSRIEHPRRENENASNPSRSSKRPRRHESDFAAKKTMPRNDRERRQRNHVSPPAANTTTRRKTLSRAMSANASLAKAFALFGFAVAIVLMLTFGLDLVFAWPLLRVSILFDVINVVCCAGLAYLSWSCWADLRKFG
jgi:hypothetical protein